MGSGNIHFEVGQERQLNILKMVLILLQTKSCDDKCYSFITPMIPFMIYHDK